MNLFPSSPQPSILPTPPSAQKAFEALLAHRENRPDCPALSLKTTATAPAPEALQLEIQILLNWALYHDRALASTLLLEPAFEQLSLKFTVPENRRYEPPYHLLQANRGTDALAVLKRYPAREGIHSDSPFMNTLTRYAQWTSQHPDEAKVLPELLTALRVPPTDLLEKMVRWVEGSPGGVLAGAAEVQKIFSHFPPPIQRTVINELRRRVADELGLHSSNYIAASLEGPEDDKEWQARLASIRGIQSLHPSFSEIELPLAIFEHAALHGWSARHTDLLALVPDLGTAAAKPEIREAVICTLLRCLATEDHSGAEHIQTLSGLSPEEIPSVAPKVIQGLFEAGKVADALLVANRFKTPLDTALSPERLRNTAHRLIAEGALEQAKHLCAAAQAHLQATQPKLVETLFIALARNAISTEAALAFAETTPLIGEARLADVRLTETPTYRVFAEQFRIPTVSSLLRFNLQHRSYIEWCSSRRLAPQLTVEDLTLLRPATTGSGQAGIPLSASDAELIVRRGGSLKSIAGDPTGRLLLGGLKMVSEHFAKLLEYLDLEGVGDILPPQLLCELRFYSGALGESEATSFIAAACKLVRNTALDADQLHHGVFLPVLRDRSDYGEYGSKKSSRTLFLELSEHKDPTALRALEACAKTIPEVAQAALEFSSTGAIFRSWESMKRFAKLDALAKSPEILRRLIALRQKQHPLVPFAVDLLTHPESRVKLNPIQELLCDAGAFLSRAPGGEEYNPNLRNLLHELMPTSLTRQLPMLGLTHEQARNALVDGSLDRIQRFHPLRIVYTLPRSGITYRSPQEALGAALGSRRQQIAGRAQHAGKLFAAVSALLKPCGLSVSDYVAGTQQLPTARQSELEGRIQELVYDQEFGIPERWVEMTAEIHRKADPRGHRVADDTASCMPFGSLKANVYAFDPTIAYFSLTIRREDGSQRPIAQSVLTLDAPIGVPFGNLYEAMKTAPVRLPRFPALQLSPLAPRAISCDNVQVAPNFSNATYDRLITAVYGDFFAEYLRRYSDHDHLDPTEVTIGQNSSRGITGLQSGGYRRFPIAGPMGYSDRFASTLWKLPTPKRALFTRREIEAPPPRSADRSFTQGIQALTLDNLLEVAHLWQTSAGATGSTSQVPGIQKLKLLLQAVEVKDASESRPGLSFLHRDRSGALSGFVFAYEGQATMPDGRAIHVEAFATRASRSRVGVRLMNYMLDLARGLSAEDALPRVYVTIQADSLSRFEAALKRLCQKKHLTAAVEPRPSANQREGELRIRIELRPAAS